MILIKTRKFFLKYAPYLETTLQYVDSVRCVLSCSVKGCELC